MSRGFIERRIIKAGIALCERRIDQKGTPITADDIRALQIRTMPPAIQISYLIIGIAIILLALWVHFTLGNMAVSVAALLVGTGNIIFMAYGKPKPVSELEDRIDLMAVTAEIVGEFVKKKDNS